MIVTIDGPAGSGKSTAAKLLAERLNIKFFNVGLVYRSIAWLAVATELSVDDVSMLIELASNMDLKIAGHEQVELSYASIQNKQLGMELREPEVDAAVHAIAAIPELRSLVTSLQQRIGEQQGGVVEGRTVGIYIFPNADAKFWLTADLDVRKSRIASQRGEAVARTVLERDEHDANRKHQPMRPAVDAVYVDSTHKHQIEIVDEMERHVRSLG